MQIFQLIKKSIPTLMGILILWFGLFFYASILNKSNQNIQKLIPSNANFVFRMNIKEFIKSSTYSLIFNSKDQELLNIFEIYLKKERKGTGKTNDFGIDFTQDLTIFGEDFKNGENYIVLFNLANADKFDKNTSQLSNKKQVFFRRGKIGMLLTYFGTEKVSKDELQNRIQAIDFKTNNTHFSENTFFDVKLNKFKINDDLHIKNGQISSILGEKELQIKGNFSIAENRYQVSKWSLIPQGLHLENSLFSKVMQDSLQKYMIDLGISLQTIQRISLNYYGIEIQETEKGVVFTPVFDLLITFKNKLNLTKIFQDTSYMSKFGFIKEKNIIHAGKLDYFIDSLDSKNLFIGNHVDQVVHRKSNNLFSLNGEISNITNIKGGGFINSFIGLLPPFKASKNLFEQIKTVDIKAIPNGNIVEVSGSLSVKDERYLFNEFLKFYLTLKGEF